MAKGRDKHQARLQAIAGLGRTLSRRAKNHCELCGEGGSLKVIEVEPVFEEPEIERAIMACPSCEDALGKKGPNPDTMRFLETAIWSETLPAQLAAVRLTRTLASQGVQWAIDALDGLYLDEDTEALIG